MPNKSDARDGLQPRVIRSVKLKKGINNDKKDSSIFSIGVMSQCEDKC